MDADRDTLAVRIDAVLPQTQCRRCGFAACRPYAEAIAAGTTAINRCPPGGDAVIAALAGLTGRARAALDPACGTHGPLTVAVIDEATCIGCRLCIDACPVDAIIGAPKRMHAVLPSLCSGCELCVAPCPVDCIAMVPAARAWTAGDADAARARHDARAVRLARRERVADRRPDAAAERARRAEAIAAALARARARRQRP
ncbi:MAG: RnfABCDGE type electron transport complex subunit B [Burkholderiales bacterium]